MAKRWGLSSRRVRVLCAEGKVEGVIRKGNLYLIPENASKPADGRATRSKRSIDNLLQSIDEKWQELKNRRPLTEGEVERLRDEFMVENIYHSNAIEGNTLTLQETALVLEGVTIAQKPLKDHLEAIGHKDAFLFIQDIAQKNLPLSESIIKQIHSLVLMDKPNDRGVYRSIPVRIMGASHQPPQPYLVEPNMLDLMQSNEKRKQTMHPIVRMALFHLEFEGIHPFVDGNGRTGRLLINLELMQLGYPTISVKFADRQKYYNAFDAYFRHGDSADMQHLIAGYVDEQLDLYLQILGEKH
jgi:Fic family protein